MALRPGLSLEAMHQTLKVGLPALLGIQALGVAEGELQMQLPLDARMLAPNGYLHAASVIALADTACGFACMAHLPEGAFSFTTIELKANFLGTATTGALLAHARALHLGRTTQVWDATVTHAESGRVVAEFRCTQMVLWPKPTLTPDPSPALRAGEGS